MLNHDRAQELARLWVDYGPIGALDYSMGVFSCGGFGLLSFAGRVILTSLNRERRAAR